VGFSRLIKLLIMISRGGVAIAEGRNRFYTLGMAGPIYDSESAIRALQERKYEFLVEYANSFAVQGVPEAQCMMGTLYQLGLGVSIAPELAERWLLEAAWNGLPIAWCNLGTLYAFGVLGSVDNAKATDCYRRAAELGGPTNVDYL
jgi:TPR repeat protein